MSTGTGLKVILALAKPLGAATWTKIKKLKPIEQFRLEQAIENAIAEVWDSLTHYFVSERVEEDKRTIVASACENELRPFAKDVTLLLKGSLDGEKLFEQLRAANPFPQEIRDEGLEQVYRMVFPLMASVLCKAPVILEQIGEKSLAEVLSRFDQLKEQLSNVSAGIVQVRHESQRKADDLYNRVLQQSLKKVLLGIEVTGLYGDSPLKQAKEEMFVLPEIEEKLTPYEEGRGKRSPRMARTPDDHSAFFLGKKHRGIVRGAPGAGKSTWSRWLQAHGMREMGLLTLHVKLRSWQEGSLPTVLELLSELVGQNMATEIDAEAVSRWVKLGNIAVLLDGFDEVSPKYRESMISAASDLAEYLQEGPCLVTSRPLHSDHLEHQRSTWTSWSIRPFDEPRILDYIRRWYSHAPLKEGASREIDASVLYSVLTEDPHVAPLTSNPLMLATLLMVHHNDGELPKGRSRLYARYIDGMLGIWDDRQEVHADISGLDREKKKRVLTSLAIALHLDDKDELSEVDTQALIGSALKSYGYGADAQQVLDSLRERSGLIIGPGSYSFSHKSVGEFLVARAICDGDRMVNGQKLDRFLLNRERSNDRWLNVIYFWAGSAPVAEVQAFIEALDDVKDLGLRLGLLWDQMDRFQIDWLGTQVRSSVLDIDELAMSDKNTAWFVLGWFGHSKPSFTDFAMIIHPRVRHVSFQDFYPFHLSALFSQVGITIEDIEVLRNNKCYNLAFDALHSDNDISERIKLVAKNDRWPLQFRKARASYNLLTLAQKISIDNAVALWDTLFLKSPDTAELWLASSMGSLWHIGIGIDAGLDKLMFSLLQRPWTPESLALSLQWNTDMTTPIERGQTDLFALLKVIFEKRADTEFSSPNLKKAIIGELDRLIASR
jgi:hypothetical protein